MQDQKRFHPKHETPKSDLSRREKIFFQGSIAGDGQARFTTGSIRIAIVSQPVKMPRKPNVTVFLPDG
jgi:hypothetical protein